VFGYSQFALVAAFLWTLMCAVLFVIVFHRKHKRESLGRFHRGLLLVGITQLALAPVYSAVHDAFSKHQAWWASAWAIVPGLLLIGWSSLFKRWEAAVAERRTTMTSREMSLSAQTAAIVLVYGFYAVQLWGQPLTPLMAVATLVGITVLMIVINIGAHITIILYAGPQRIDERDRAVALKGTRNAYHVLSVGVWCILFLAIAHTPNIYIFYAIMGVFAFAELVRLSSQLVYYRLGV
jgi:hypothetical protein